MRFQAKKYFFKNILIFLLLEDPVGAEKKLEKYNDEDPSLNNSYELKFLTGVIEDFKNGNQDEFGNKCFQLNSRITLDKPMTATLAEIKKKINKKDLAHEDEFNPF